MADSMEAIKAALMKNRNSSRCAQWLPRLDQILHTLNYSTFPPIHCERYFPIDLLLIVLGICTTKGRLEYKELKSLKIKYIQNTKDLQSY